MTSMAFALSLLLAVSSSSADNTVSRRCDETISSVEDADGAVSEVRRRLIRDKVYSSDGSLRCYKYRVSASTDGGYFDVSVHESHQPPDCKGDPGTEPTRDIFRVYRNSDVVLWLDIPNARYLSWCRFLEQEVANR